uniref:Ig-like domain-containing protein n=1 Tax=Rhabditophanes sp. KR3021 TaxID=114890 RepID=A0AC35U0D0_9BILA
MLVSVGATTALMCDPIVGANDKVNMTATWFKNDDPIAKVTSNSNVILFDRTINSKHLIPQVGFLILTNITADDQGFYHCQREDNKAEGETIHLVIAYIEQFDSKEKELVMIPKRPYLGNTIRIDCPSTDAYPAPAVKWHKNGIDLNFSNNRYEVLSNGSLLIRRLTSRDIGFFECILSNFAGYTKGTAFVDAYGDETIQRQRINNQVQQFSIFSTIKTLDKVQIKHGLLWFSIVCLLGSCFVLIYLLMNIFWTNRSFRNKVSRLFVRMPCVGDKSFGGYGRSIVPAPDFVYRRNRNESASVSDPLVV